MRTRRLLGLAGCCLTLLGPATARSEFEKEQTDIDRLVAQRRYRSAAAYIHERPELRSQPRFLRQLSHLLVGFYAHTINFRLFGLRDLADGEDIAKVRGTPGQYVIIGGDLEKLLHDAVAARPDDPDIQFAVGEYLARGEACGCARPTLFVGDGAHAYPYFERAHRAGVFDGWSLFTMGVHHLSSEKPADLRKALELFEHALKLEPDLVDAHYDAAIACLQLGDHGAARVHSAKALGRYGSAELDADAYNVHARIEAAAGNTAAAEKAFDQALTLRPGHAGAFSGLLALLRSAKRFDDYGRRAAAFIALDRANTYPFGVYLDDVARAGVTDADRALGRELAKRAYTRPEEVGAVFYGLGRLAELDSDRALAHRHYTRSLAALRSQEKPPPGSIDALTALVRRTAPDEGK